jgi:tight adherence protein C
MSLFDPTGAAPRSDRLRRRNATRGGRSRTWDRRPWRSRGSRWDSPYGGVRHRVRAGGDGSRAVVASLTVPGLALIALLGGLAADAPGLLAGSVVVAVGWPIGKWTWRRRTAARRLAMRREAAPAVLDLLSAALLAGLNPHLAVLRITERAPDALHDELALAAGVLRLGGTPAAALRAAAERSGIDELRAAAGALEAAERWGAPPAEALAARAEALRTRARLRAEAEAGRAAVRLAFPLVLCFLPSFVLTNVEL